MPEYVLSSGQPRAGTTVYETRRLRRECADATAAIQWAREAAAWERAPSTGYESPLAVPVVIWLIEARGRSVIWEHTRLP